MALPTYDEAKSYLNDPYACFKLQTITKHISLLPRYIGSLRVGIQNILDTDLKQYSEKLGGVVIAYTNIRRLQPFGVIFEDLCHLHFDVKVDVIVFKPTLDCTLKAVVNKLTDTHVGCLVHNCFNASISKPGDLQAPDWEGSKLLLGQEFQFKVSNISSQNGLIFIRGKIPVGSLSEVTSPKKKKKKKRKLSDRSAEELDVNDEPARKKHKSKKSKGYSRRDSPENTTVHGDISVTESELDASFVKKHKSKKKKKLRDHPGFDSPKPIVDCTHTAGGRSDRSLDISMDVLSKEASALLATVVPKRHSLLVPKVQSPETEDDDSDFHLPVLQDLPEEWPSVGTDSGVSSILSSNSNMDPMSSRKKSKKHKHKSPSLDVTDCTPKKHKKKKNKSSSYDSEVLTCSNPKRSTEQALDDSIFQSLSFDGSKSHKHKRKHKIHVKSFM